MKLKSGSRQSAGHSSNNRKSFRGRKMIRSVTKDVPTRESKAFGRSKSRATTIESSVERAVHTRKIVCFTEGSSDPVFSKDYVGADETILGKVWRDIKMYRWSLLATIQFTDTGRTVAATEHMPSFVQTVYRQRTVPRWSKSRTQGKLRKMKHRNTGYGAC